MTTHAIRFPPPRRLRREGPALCLGWLGPAVDPREGPGRGLHARGQGCLGNHLHRPLHDDDERGQRKAYGGVTPTRAASSKAFRAVAAASTASSTLVEAAVSIT